MSDIFTCFEHFIMKLFIYLNELLQIVLYTYKSKNLLLPNSCLGYCLINNCTSYIMRNSQDFLTPSFSTNIREQSINVMGPRVWQFIPIVLRASERLDIFTRAVHNHFLSVY